MMDTAEQIKALRAATGLTQKEFAARLRHPSPYPHIMESRR